jgi:hypothetical protein
MVDDNGRRRKYVVIPSVIVVDLRVDEEDDGFIGNLLNRSQHIAGGQRAVATIYHHDAFLSHHHAASRGGLIGRVDVDPVFDLRESRPEILRTNWPSQKENRRHKNHRHADPQFHNDLLHIASLCDLSG